MSTPTPTARAVVDAYLDAIARWDYPAARRCLADKDFEYTGPINSFNSAEDLISYLELVTPIVQRIEVQKVFVDGDDVCHILLFTTQLSEKSSVDVVQWARVRSGRIVRLQVIFDSYEYRMLFVQENE